MGAKLPCAPSAVKGCFGSQNLLLAKNAFASPLSTNNCNSLTPTKYPLWAVFAASSAIGIDRANSDPIGSWTCAMKAVRGGRTRSFVTPTVTQGQKIKVFLRTFAILSVCFCLAIPAGFEPATIGLEGRCSIQLSYGTVMPKRIRQAAPGRKEFLNASKEFGGHSGNSPHRKSAGAWLLSVPARETRCRSSRRRPWPLPSFRK